MSVGTGEVTQLLIELRQGDQDAEQKLIPLVYKELHRLASRHMRAERPGQSLQATALVHEAYKPPKHSQFKPGQSGNPKGRPKKAKTIADAFSKLARKVVTVPTKGGNKRMSMLDLIANKHFGMAANGNHKSTEIVLRALMPAEANHDNNIDDLLLEFREKNARIAEENQGPASTDRENSLECEDREANEGPDR